MKKILSSLLVLVAFSTFAQTPAAKKNGHQPQTPEQRATAIASHLEKNLTLTADQKTKVHDLALAKEQAIGKLREAHKDQDPCSWKDERKKVQDTFENGMKSTLTPEQFQKWETLKKQQEEKRKEHMRGRQKPGK